MSLRRTHLLAAACYLAVAAYWCSGLLADPLHRLPFYGGDGTLTLWNYWWARWALLVLHRSPLATTYLSYPHEASLVFQAHDLLHGVLSIPLQLAVPGPSGVVLSVNMATFFCYLASAIAGYAWIWFLVGSWPAALVAGFGYAFSAHHHSWAPMPVLAALYWLPLYATLFVRAVRRDGLRPALWPGLCLALCTFQSLYYTLFLGVLTVFLGALVSWTEGPWQRVGRRLRTIAAVLVVAALPMGTLVVHDLAHGRYVSVGARTAGAPKNVDDDCRASIDLAGLVIPGPDQGLWRSVAPGWNQYRRRPGCHAPLFGLNGVGGEVTYVGPVVLLLAALAWRAAPRRVALAWSLGTGFFIGLALGPYLHVYGTIQRDWWWPLPYRMLLAIPTLSRMYRAPSSFWVLGLFGIWTLAAFGLHRLFTAEGRWRRRALAVVVAAWLVVDYGSLPLPSWPARWSPVYDRIAADPDPAGVLDLPTYDFLALETYSAAQIVHRRPLARGFLARADTMVLERDERILAAYRSIEGFRALVAELAPVYVNLHKQLLTAPQRALVEMLAKHYLDARVYEDAEVVSYRLTAAIVAPGTTPPSLAPVPR